MLADLTTEVGFRVQHPGLERFSRATFCGLKFLDGADPSSSLVDKRSDCGANNGGNYAAVMVTAATAARSPCYVMLQHLGTKIQGLTSVTLGGPAAPQINQVQ